MRGLRVLWVVLIACAAAPVAIEACGDKFLLVGRGLAFGRAYASVYPGSILIYSGPQTTPQHEKMAQYMRRAGHRVTLISDEATMSRTLVLGQTDIVIADVGMRASLETQAASVPLRPSMLYMVNERDRQRAELLAREVPGALKGSDKANRFLVQIEEMMKARQQAGVRVKRG